MIVKRDGYAEQFYQHVFNFWLFTQVQTGNITAPGYLEAKRSGNMMVCEAYQVTRFTGSMFPHIDPLKEVKAERLKLGTNADHIPLGTVEKSTEFLGSGEASSNMEQFAEEVQKAEDLGLEPKEAATVEPSNDGGGDGEGIEGEND